MAMGKYHSGSSFITDFFNVVILLAGGVFLYKGLIDAAGYATFIVSVNLFISPIMTLINFMESFQNGVSGFRRYVEIMDLPEEEDEPGAYDPGVLKGGLLKKRVRKIKVRGLLENIPENITSDISGLDINDVTKISDIHVDNLEIVDNPNKVVIAVIPTRGSAAAATEEGEAEEA